MPVIAHVIPTLLQGGAERLLCDLIRKDSTNRNIVIKLFSGRDLFDDEIVQHAATMYSLGLSRSLPLNMLILPVAATRLIWLLIVHRPALVVGWLYYGALAASLGRLVKVPVIWSIHAADFDIQTAFKPVTRLAIRACIWLARSCPAIIQYCSVRSQDQHEGLGFPSVKSLVIENGIDVERFAPAQASAAQQSSYSSESKHQSGTKVIACIARFEPQKDHRTLLAAAAGLKARGRSFSLVLAGRGCERTNQELWPLVEEYGLEQETVPLGVVKNVDQVLRCCDCLVLSSSDGEAMPIVVLEALALGRPVVATDVGNTAEMIGDFGLVVPPRQPETLSEALEQVLWYEPAYQEAAQVNGPEWIQRRYSLDKTLFEWNMMIANVLNTPNV